MTTAFKQMTMKPLGVLTFIFMTFVSCSAVELAATVIRIQDGDTLIVQVDDRQLTIGLKWITAPRLTEGNQGLSPSPGKDALKYLQTRLPTNTRIMLWDSVDTAE